MYILQLFDACMEPSVPPHDALLSVEGPLMINESKNLFKSEWFLSNCWESAVTSCLKVSVSSFGCFFIYHTFKIIIVIVLLSHG